MAKILYGYVRDGQTEPTWELDYEFPGGDAQLDNYLHALVKETKFSGGGRKQASRLSLLHTACLRMSEVWTKRGTNITIADVQKLANAERQRRESAEKQVAELTAMLLQKGGIPQPNEEDDLNDQSEAAQTHRSQRKKAAT